MHLLDNIKLKDNVAAHTSDSRPPSTAPPSESGCTASSDWSKHSSPAHSSTALSLPHVRLARSVRGAERAPKNETEAPFPSVRPAFYRSHIRPPSPPPPASKPKRIPRPPNAFILFRSDLLKHPEILKNGPPHQQTLSRLAGECWNLLKDHEKKKWQELANERAAIHEQEYPGYRFKPSPRGKGKAKARAVPGNSDALVRELRETYLGISGPSICHSRERKDNKLRAQEVKPTVVAPRPIAPPAFPWVSSSGPEDLSAFRWHAPTQPKTENSHCSRPIAPPSISPHDTSYMSPYSWIPSHPAPGYAMPPLSLQDPSMRKPSMSSFVPQHTFPHFPAPRRPSTSLGFIRKGDTAAFDPGFDIERPLSAAGMTNLGRNLDFMPIATHFDSLSMPATPLLNEHSFLFAVPSDVPSSPEEQPFSEDRLFLENDLSGSFFDLNDNWSLTAPPSLGDGEL